jgi:hypothetical protein
MLDLAVEHIKGLQSELQVRVWYANFNLRHVHIMHYVYPDQNIDKTLQRVCNKPFKTLKTAPLVTHT